MRTVAVIPARIGSSRLPRKVLLPIAGRPMIAHVAERVRAARGLDDVVVATDSHEVVEALRDVGVPVVLTPADCPSGTDRVAIAVASRGADLILNIQGDEPLISPSTVETLAATLRTAVSRGWDYATLARPLHPDEADKPQVVKVVCGDDGAALYFSRSLIPYPRTPDVLTPLAHVGLYGYTRAGLERWTSLPVGALEQAEGLEQLRVLATGARMLVGVGEFATQAVDTAEDLEAVRRLFDRSVQ